METFFWSIFFGIIGMGYFSFGKKQVRYDFVLSGIALMLFPYVVDGLSANIVVGIILLLFPFLVQKFPK